MRIHAKSHECRPSINILPTSLSAGQTSSPAVDKVDRERILEQSQHKKPWDVPPDTNGHVQKKWGHSNVNRLWCVGSLTQTRLTRVFRPRHHSFRLMLCISDIRSLILPPSSLHQTPLLAFIVCDAAEHTRDGDSPTTACSSSTMELDSLPNFAESSPLHCAGKVHWESCQCLGTDLLVFIVW